MLAYDWLRFFGDGFPALEAELRTGREVLAAFRASLKNQHLMSAVRTEPGVSRDRQFAVGAGDFGRCGGITGASEGFGKHGGHHETHAHTEPRTCFAPDL